MRPNFHLQNI